MADLVKRLDEMEVEIKKTKFHQSSGRVILGIIIR